MFSLESDLCNGTTFAVFRESGKMLEQNESKLGMLIFELLQALKCLPGMDQYHHNQHYDNFWGF